MYFLKISLTLFSLPNPFPSFLSFLEAAGHFQEIRGNTQARDWGWKWRSQTVAVEATRKIGLSRWKMRREDERG